MNPKNLITKWVSAMFTFSLMAGSSSAQAVISLNQTATPHQGATISLQAKSTTSLAASNLTKLVTITLPKDTQMNSLKAVLNGTSVSAQFSQATCAGGVCATGLLSQIDGLRFGKNVLFATAKKQDGSAVSTRIRFAMDYSGGTGLRAMAAGNVSQVNAQQTALPTSSSFLPPAVGLTALSGGPFPDGPWLQLGTQTKINAANCRFNYSVMVLDRQTLVPEPYAGCYGDGASLASYLKTLTSQNIVVVATNQNYTTDASSDNGFFDTTAIGGTAYNCPSGSTKNGCASSSTSPDIPQGYLIIGAGGATPGQAYEVYRPSNVADPAFDPQANGMLVEDANGNYNFQATNAVEYIVNPGKASSSISITNAPSAPGRKVVYTSPQGTNGFWLLLMNRADLSASPACPAGSTSSSEIDVPNCGQFFATGAGSIDTNNALANALHAVTPQQLAILTTVGTAGWDPSPFNMANNRGNGTFDPSDWFDNGTIELGQALAALGAPDKAILYLGQPGSAYTYITSPGMGNAIGGGSVLSSTVYSQQGETGYVHGTLTRNLRGLYAPGRTQQETAGADYANLQLGLISSMAPVEWPEFASVLPGATSGDGQKAAYAYLSWYLLNGWYAQGGSSEGVSGPEKYDIHYFFTGSLNTWIDYHTYDPADAVFPGAVGFSGRMAYPCVMSGNTCTWTNPFDQTVLTFTQADFKAVQTQMHAEVVNLTNVLLFMVNGSTNMKDIIAAGNSNTALALLQATSEIEASLGQPKVQNVKAKVNPWSIVNMIGGGLTTASAMVSGGIINPGEIEGLDNTIGLVADLFTNAGGAGGGFTTAGDSQSSGLPGPQYSLLTTVGNLASLDLQGGLLAGFDTTLDTITSDWAKLNALGPQITNPENKAFYAPNQVLQNAAIQSMKQATQRSLYLSIIPSLYQVHRWPMGMNLKVPDVGYTSNGNSNSCQAFYPNYNSSVYDWSSDPTYGGTRYTNYWAATSDPKFYPFKYNYDSLPVDLNVIAEPFQNVGKSDATAQLMTSQLATTLFSNNPGALNFSFSQFVAHNGPLTNSVTGVQSDLDFALDLKPGAFTNPAGFYNDHICRISEMNELQASSGSGDASTTATVTAITVPSAVVLGEDVKLEAAVVFVNNTATPTGSVEFREGKKVLNTTVLDLNGKASTTTHALTIGDHTLTAYFVPDTGSSPSNSIGAMTTVYANAPDLTLSLSATDVQASYTAISTPVTLKVQSRSGMKGTLKFSCSGLPSGMSCSFTPSQAAITSGGNVSTTFNISGAGPAAQAGLGSAGWTLLLLPVSLLGLFGLSKGGRKLAGQGLCLALLAGATLAALTGCGGSATLIRETGSKTVLVVVTDGSVTRTVPLVVNIQ